MARAQAVRREIYRVAAPFDAGEHAVGRRLLDAVVLERLAMGAG